VRSFGYLILPSRWGAVWVSVEHPREDIVAKALKNLGVDIIEGWIQFPARRISIGVRNFKGCFKSD